MDKLAEGRLDAQMRGPASSSPGRSALLLWSRQSEAGPFERPLQDATERAKRSNGGLGVVPVRSDRSGEAEDAVLKFAALHIARVGPP
jgi:hypothetical protein